MEADDATSPCRPRNLSSEWEEKRKGPDLLVWTPEFPSPETSRSQKPIEEGSEGVPAVPVSFGTDMTDSLTEPASLKYNYKSRRRRFSLRWMLF
eukprot:162286-Pleurochrysis_carterae.AAC.1